MDIIDEVIDFVETPVVEKATSEEETEENIKKPRLTLKKALSSGLVIEVEKVEEIIKARIEAIRDQMKVDILKEIEESKHKVTDNQVENYLSNSRISDIEFGRRLFKMNVPKYALSVLDNTYSHLDDKALWGYLRKNYRGKYK